MTIDVIAGFAWGATAAFATYYGLYEGLHAIMHVPKSLLFIHKNRIVQAMNLRHQKHHQRPNTNLNVVLPLVDWISRTGA